MSKHAQISELKDQVTQPVDERILQISQDILPSTPYLLKVPSGGYRGYPHQANDWKRSCPFGPNEERLQYLTFRSHFGKDTMLNAEGDWDDGKGNIKDTRDNKPSGLNTPLLGQPPKKKITLSDYKNKAAGHTSVKAAPTKSVEETKTSLKGINSGSLSPPPKPQHSEPPQGVKRSADHVQVPKDTKTHSPPHSPPAKKARLSSNSTSAVPPAKALPAKVAKPAVWDLPPMLSPTLPPDIEEELSRMRMANGSSGHIETDSAATSTPEKKPMSTAPSAKDGPRVATKVAKDNTDYPQRKGAPSKELKTKTNHERQAKSTSDQPSSEPTANGVTTPKTSKQGSKIGDKNAVSSISTPSSTPQKPERKGLIVKLKIPKSLRRNIMRLLQMQPRSSQKVDNEVAKPDRNGESNDTSRDKGLHNGIVPNLAQPKAKSTHISNSNEKRFKVLEDNSKAPKSGEKRKRLDDKGTTPDPASKRQKHPGGPELSQKPHTPIRPPIKSPVLSQSSSAQKSQLSTPKREMKSTAMHRIGSSEGDVKTPAGAVRGGTPTATSTAHRVNREGRSSSNTSSGGTVVPRNEDIAAWKSEKKKFEALGRTLKHEARAALPKDLDWKSDTPSMRKGAAIAIEAVLAFTLAFTINEEINRLSRQPMDSIAWRSLIPFLHYVENVTGIYRPLLGLTYQLEAVCRDTISLRDAERLERDAISTGGLDDQRPSTAESGVNHSSPPTTEKAKPDAAVELAENLRQAQHKWQLGYSECSVREMQRSLPTTWEKSAGSPGPGKGKEKLSPKSYRHGAYYLPLGPTTSAIEGVRVGWQMLGEWCEKNEVGWEGKLGL